MAEEKTPNDQPLQDCSNNYEIKDYIHKESFGTFGRVLEACKDGDCKWIVKISHVGENMNRYENAKMDVFMRDVYLLKTLNKLKTPYLAPRLPDVISDQAWVCNGEGYVVMERFDHDLYKVITKKYVVQHPNGVQQYKLPSHLFHQMIHIMCELSTLGIIHNDVKFENFLIRKEQTREGRLFDRVVITDFGFASDNTPNAPIGTFGNHDPFKYGNTPNDPVILCDKPWETFDPYINIWMLETYVLKNEKLILVQTDEEKDEWNYFSGFDIPSIKMHRHEFNSHCAEKRGNARIPLKQDPPWEVFRTTMIEKGVARYEASAILQNYPVFQLS